MKVFKHKRAEGRAEPPVPGQPSAQGHVFIPDWYHRVGLAAWYTIGIVIVLLGTAYLLHLLSTLVVPTLFAILLAATFLPVVDWMERHHIGRTWGALLVMILIIVGAGGILVLMTVGVIHQWPTIEAEIQSGVDAFNDYLEKANIDPDLVNSAKTVLSNNVGSVTKGLFGGALSGIRSLAGFLFGVFIGLNILVYVLAGGRQIGRWLSRHAGPVPPSVAYSILADSARFLRGYIWGSTLIGIFNGVVVGVGALVIGVPLAFTIGIVQWFSNYIPMFGALIGGAFAVLIALGTGGIAEAVWMLIFVLIANGPIQTVISQFALGASLKLSGLVVLFVTTGGAVIAGALGGVFAAPFTKICIDGYRRLKAAGLFEDGEQPVESEQVAVNLQTAEETASGSGPPG